MNAIEKAARQFIRATLKARITGEVTLRGRSIKTEIANPETVLEVLSQSCKVVRTTKRGTVFAYKEGKGRNAPVTEINVSRVMGHDMLTLTAEQ